MHNFTGSETEIFTEETVTTTTTTTFTEKIIEITEGFKHIILLCYNNPSSYELRIVNDAYCVHHKHIN